VRPATFLTLVRGSPIGTPIVRLATGQIPPVAFDGYRTKLSEVTDTTELLAFLARWVWVSPLASTPFTTQAAAPNNWPLVLPLSQALDQFLATNPATPTSGIHEAIGMSDAEP